MNRVGRGDVLDRIEEPLSAWPVNGLPATLADRTRRVYDRMAAVYPVSTMLFHSRAHQSALEASGIADGMQVLEVATGSGEMFRRLVKANASGATIGVDLDRKSTRLNSSHLGISYAVFCLKKKKT